MRPTHHTTRTATKGMPLPQGATLTKEGVNFALYSSTAEAVWLLLFDDADSLPTDCIALTGKTDNVWHAHVQGLKAGQLYGYKIDGPYAPAQGLWFNPHRLLIDPYARALTHSPAASDCRYAGYEESHLGRGFIRDTVDNTIEAPKSVVVDNAFNWEDDHLPRLPRESLIVYEAHLKGFTAHASAGVHAPGTYAGFIEKIPYLKKLGINAVELLPVHEIFSPGHLTGKGLKDYWGYNSIAFFAPAARYAADVAPGRAVIEFKTLVKALHAAGIEVILDVVYNHSGEGSGLGPTLAFRGIDNNAYYVTEGPPDVPRQFYRNDAGCGNMLNTEHAQVRRLILDSLRYWVQEMHVDGFRFDLATVLGRHHGRFSTEAPLFRAMACDPVLSKTRLIAEPWDVVSYKSGQFPPGWMEWNDRFRDTWRRFLKGDSGQLADLGRRLTGSEEMHRHRGGYPFSSVNFITCHDGFTLHDLYAYNHKHNSANGEENRDGSDANLSWNCGAEGETERESTLRLRQQMMKNAICGLLFSQGMPMLLAGDELGRTQRGNNNAYCQDNAISWMDWSLKQRNGDLYRFVKRAIALRKKYAVLHRRTYLSGEDISGNGVADIQWYDKALRPPAWNDEKARLIAFQLDGHEHGGEDYRLFIVFNAHARPQSVKLPPLAGMAWYHVVDTAQPPPGDIYSPGYEQILRHQKQLRVKGRSTVLLLARPSQERESLR